MAATASFIDIPVNLGTESNLTAKEILRKRVKRGVQWGLAHVRLMPGNHLHWADPQRFSNVGDLVGPYLFHALTGTHPVNVEPSNWSLRGVYLTAGSIANRAKWNSIVWGSGIMFADSYLERPQQILAVRGPRTRDRYLDFGIECPSVFGDPGILLPKFLKARAEPVTGRIGVVPHHVDSDGLNQLIAGDPRLKLIDVRVPVEEFVQAVVACEAVVSTSLHGLIIAHAYGVPARHVVFSDRLSGDGVKFDDYYQSVHLVHSYDHVKERRGLYKAADRAETPAQAQLDEMGAALLAVCPFGGTQHAPS